LENFVVGQRWISEMEPELGLGKLTQVENRKVRILFTASECERLYAIESAPLKRVRFKIGDEVKNQKGESFTVLSVAEMDGFIVYHGDNFILPESELSDTFSFTTPKDRLLNGIVDPKDIFNLRYEIHKQQYKILKSKIHGFIGGRLDLISHQFYIAEQIVSRYIPRVLLADEIGLGKTIETCLILHQLLLTNRISRVLILVPETLVHQWFVELLRKFNLLFRIFDEDYCSSIDTNSHTLNPFLEDQLGICNIHFLSRSEKRKQQAIDAGWDMIVVDEAHHLTDQSAAYKLVENLGKRTNGMILLTATPEQLGQQNHFNRLRLLDPARYNNYNSFLDESKKYIKIAEVIDKLLENKPFSENDFKKYIKIYKGPKSKNFQEEINSDNNFREKLIDHLLDQHGVGRVMFRNTRATITGFPKRVTHLIPLSCSKQQIIRSNQELNSELDNQILDFKELSKDPKVLWVVGLLKKQKAEKILMICKSKQKVLAIHNALLERIKVKAAMFHEEMTIIQRDRNAAWFSEKDGAQILICSEIGSEGRNFQFAHHLVLFDLPLDPELLEQRIGRLDRIGQIKTINIHVPYITGSAQEVLAKWYHEGLNSFEKNVPGVYQIYQNFGKKVKDLLIKSIQQANVSKTSLNNLIQQTNTFGKKLATQLEQGRDRLLDLNSFKPQKANETIQQIKEIDKDKSFEHFMLKLFDFFGVRYEDFEDRSYHLNFDALKNNAFPIPLLREEGLMATFNRQKAISCEDYEFLNWDHPMVSGSMDLILGSEQGNSSFAIWFDNKTQAIYLETIFILESVAPLSLKVDRFLPATPIRILLNHYLEDCVKSISPEFFEKKLVDGQPEILVENSSFAQDLFLKMLKTSNKLAEKRKSNIIQKGLEESQNTLQKEIHRLKSLIKINPNIKREEIFLCEEEYQKLKNYISSARLRLDSLRLIYRGEVELEEKPA